MSAVVVSQLLTRHGQASHHGLLFNSLRRWPQSDPHPLRSLTSFAADLEALADGLLPGRRFFLAGASGGGPYALAAAIRMRSRVRGVLLIGPASHQGAPARVLPLLFKLSIPTASSMRWPLPLLRSRVRTALLFSPALQQVCQFLALLHSLHCASQGRAV